MGPRQKTGDLVQGTLDMLILKIVGLGPIHGYAISRRIQQISREAQKVQQVGLLRENQNGILFLRARAEEKFCCRPDERRWSQPSNLQLVSESKFLVYEHNRLL